MKALRQWSLFLLFAFTTFQLFAQCFSEQTFTTPGQSTFTLPGTVADSYTIEIEAKGADGGDFLWGGNPQTDGGEGATMKASFVLNGGSNLLVVVGFSGLDAPGSPGGGGGGGGTAVILNNTDVLIAAGAGGGGGQGATNTGQGGQASTNSAPVGGAGLGSAGGGGFNAPGGNGPASGGGGAGTLNGQGTGGAGGITAGAGGTGFGGGGGGSGTVGGGGGGYKGGDGSDGSTDKNGKGGDSFVNSLFSGTLIFNTPGADGGGANNNGSVIITCIPQSSVQISLVSSTQPACFGGFDGSIEVAATGGTAPYTYSINGGTFGNSPTFSGLSAGNYTITVMDGSGDTDMLMVTLSSPPQLIGEILNVTNNACFGDAQGSIGVTAFGGTSATGTYGFSINGSPVQSSGLFTNLANGFYVISIFDDNQCTDQVSTSITSPDDLEIIVVAKMNVSCAGANDGFISVDAFGGTGVYMYSIDNGPFDSSPQFFDLSGGTYNIKVKDEADCEEDITVSLSEPDPVTFDLSASNPTCYGEADGEIEVIDITGTAPFEFKIDEEDASSNPLFTGLVAGDYIITVIDSAGCAYMQDVQLVNPDSLMLSLTVVQEVQCGGDSTGAVMLEVQNGVGTITYSVDQTFNFSGSFENLAAGEHSASATDSLGCTTELIFDLQESATFVLSVDTTTAVGCFGGSDGSVLVSVVDGIDPIQFTINGTDYQDAPLFEGLQAGDYTIEAVDSTGCVKTVQLTIDQPSPLQFTYFVGVDVSCYGNMTGQVALLVDGGTPGYSYEENGVVMTFGVTDTIVYSGLGAGSFVATIEDSNGCVLTDTMTISQNDSLQLSVVTLEGDNCGENATGMVDLDAAGGLAPYAISVNGASNADGIFDSLAVGDYTATVEDALGCMTSLDFNIPQLDGLILDSLLIGDVSCNGGSDGFVEFFVSNGTGTISIGAVDIIFDSTFIDNLGAGSFNFVAFDEAGCYLEIDFEINQPDPLTIELIEANVEEGYITVAANGGTPAYGYSIDDKTTIQDSATFAGLEFGEYTIIVVDANGCEASIMHNLVAVNDSDFSDIKLYPNPVSNMLNIDFTAEHSNVNVDIINKLGQVVKSFDRYSLISNGDGVQIQLKGLQSGSYILRLRQNEKVGYYQIVIVQ